MNRILRTFLCLTVCLGLLLASCSNQAGAPGQQLAAAGPAATLPPTDTSTPPPTDTPTITPDLPATQAARQTADAQATAAVIAATATQNQVNRQATSDVEKAFKQTATAEVKATTAAQETKFKLVVDQLLADGVVTTSDGTYKRLEDFDESWAQLGWYDAWLTGVEAENFILAADVAWESASKTADWPSSGCGILFSQDDWFNYHVVFLTLDGWGVLGREAKDTFKILAARSYGKLDVPSGQARIMLVVDADRIHFYVNDKKVVTAYDSSIDKGEIAYTLLSGTNKDFGTRCQMTNVDMYVLK